MLAAIGSILVFSTSVDIVQQPAEGVGYWLGYKLGRAVNAVGQQAQKVALTLNK